MWVNEICAIIRKPPHSIYLSSVFCGFKATILNQLPTSTSTEARLSWPSVANFCIIRPQLKGILHWRFSKTNIGHPQFPFFRFSWHVERFPCNSIPTPSTFWLLVRYFHCRLVDKCFILEKMQTSNKPSFPAAICLFLASHAINLAWIFTRLNCAPCNNSHAEDDWFWLPMMTFKIR